MTSHSTLHECCKSFERAGPLASWYIGSAICRTPSPALSIPATSIAAIDNKRVILYKRQDSKSAQFSPWTSETTRTKITQENLLLVGVKLTRAGKLSAEDLDKLQACPHIQWHLPVTEPPSFFD